MKEGEVGDGRIDDGDIGGPPVTTAVGHRADDSEVIEKGIGNEASEEASAVAAVAVAGGGGPPTFGLPSAKEG